MKLTIYIFLLTLLSLLVVSCVSIKRPVPEPVTKQYRISNVNVVDVVDKKIKFGHDVTVKNGLIVSIEPHIESGNITSQIALAKQKNKPIVINGRGKYLIPGLWDNHSTVLQISPEIDFPLYIANGVTSIRSNLSCANEDEISIYACTQDKSIWQQAIKSATMIGPTIQGWGTFPITGKGSSHPDLPSFHGVTTVEQARQVVDHYASLPQSQRPFFLKTYNWIMPEPYAELSHYAKQHGFELSGHMPRSLTLTEVINAGQRSIAHARLFVFDCSTIAAELQAGAHRKTSLPQRYRLLIDSFDAKGCEQRYQYMADHDVFLNPTLMTRRNDYYAVAGMLDKIQGLNYVHYLMMMEFSEDAAKLGENLSRDDILAFKDFYLLTADTIAKAQKAGVKILAGSDSWNEYNVPGFSLHEELQALADAGIDNYGILQAATINGAEYFRIADKVGSIDIGKQADMVLLEANPIDDIKHTQRINSVFKGSQIYQSEELNRLKKDVESLSNSHFLTAKILMMLMQNPRGF